MKKVLTLLLCLVMVMSFAGLAFAFKIDPSLGGGGTAEPAEITNFKNLVDSIGEVTKEDKETIEAAEAALAAINWRNYGGSSKIVQEWINKLEAARTAYNALATEPSTQPGASTTQPAGSVTPVKPMGDNTFVFFALMALSVTAMVVLVSKKKVF